MVSKKQLRSFLKHELIKIAKDNGIEYNKKDSKVMLIEKINKNKSVMKSLTTKEKKSKPASEKQIEARRRFAEAARARRKTVSEIKEEPSPKPVPAPKNEKAQEQKKEKLIKGLHAI